jgi:hypothetical protein
MNKERSLLSLFVSGLKKVHAITPDLCRVKVVFWVVMPPASLSVPPFNTSLIRVKYDVEPRPLCKKYVQPGGLTASARGSTMTDCAVYGEALREGSTSGKETGQSELG